MTDAIKDDIKSFIMNEFLPGEDPGELTDDTPLITGGILDSIATLKLVMHLEEKYRVTFAPHEVDKENLDTLDLITAFVRDKLKAGG